MSTEVGAATNAGAELSAAVARGTAGAGAGSTTASTTGIGLERDGGDSATAGIGSGRAAGDSGERTSHPGREEQAVVATDPMALARQWLPDNDDPVRPQMTLATTGPDGPSGRTVLLSSLEPDGWCFHTDARSAKAVELAADPRACLVLVWPDFWRQLVVQGSVVPLSGGQLAAAYAARSSYLRQLAWLNDARFARLPDHERRARWAAAVAEHPDGPAEPSPHWAGYLLRPRRLVFWESAADTASRRTEYVRTASGWSADHLPG